MGAMKKIDIDSIVDRLTCNVLKPSNYECPKKAKFINDLLKSKEEKIEKPTHKKNEKK